MCWSLQDNCWGVLKTEYYFGVILVLIYYLTSNMLFIYIITWLDMGLRSNIGCVICVAISQYITPNMKIAQALGSVRKYSSLKPIHMTCTKSVIYGGIEGPPHLFFIHLLSYPFGSYVLILSLTDESCWHRKTVIDWYWAHLCFSMQGTKWRYNSQLFPYAIQGEIVPHLIIKIN